MNGKLATIVCLCVLLSCSSFVRFKPVEVRVSDGYPVHNVYTGLNYTSIQEALAAPETVDGHTILVDPGTYYECVGVHKSVSLIGEDKATTVIDGNRTGIVVRVTVDDVYISGFTIKNSSGGYLSSCIFLDNNRNTTIVDNIIGYGDDVCIFLNHSRGNSILNNTITNPSSDGICLRSSSENRIIGNNISRTWIAIELEDSSNNNVISHNNVTGSALLDSSSFNTLRNNALSDYFTGDCWFDVYGSSLEHYIQDIDETNTVNGRPIYYWVNQRGKQIPSDAGYIIVVNSTDITVRDLTLNGHAKLVHTNNSRIEKITIGTLRIGQPHGIVLKSSHNNTISHSQLVDRDVNIAMISSHNNIFVANNVTGSRFRNLVLYSSCNNVVADNILSFSREGTDGVGVVMSKGGNNVVCDNTLSANYRGIWIDSSNNIIRSNLITKSWEGILMEYWFGIEEPASNNTICNNLITENHCGIALRNRNSSNRFYHNNLIDNQIQAGLSVRITNSWDNGFEGNYWSDYNGTDLNHDGVGDSRYEINENNTDRYPLMGMFHSFNASMGYGINAISNSAIDYFAYVEGNSTISMYVSNTTANQTYGFCRLGIPKDLMPPPYTVIIDDGLTEVLHFNDTVYDNGTYRWIYFAYPHSTHEIRITPEFPSNIIIPLFMITTLLAATIYARKRYS
jgi:parallel beta-helix repeat protein